MSESSASSLRALLFASTAAGMLAAAPAFAADEATTPDVQTTQQQSTTLSDIDVNGKPKPRRPESPEFVAPLVDTPRAVTVIPQQIIEQTAATSLEDLLRTSPGITFGAGEGGQPLAERPFIRGQSSGNNIFVDGVRDSGGQSREVFNSEQVEVIKGPDSVYSGRGSGGGSINLGSKAPRLTDFINVGAAVGTDSYYRATIDGNWRFNDTTAFRLNLLASEGDTPGRDAVDFEKYGLAMSFATGLDTDTTATLSYYRLRSDSMPDYGIPLYTKLGGATAPRPDPSGVLDVPYDSFYGLKARDFLENSVDSVTLKLEHRINDNLSIRNVTRYSETLNDYVVTNPGDGGNAQLIGGEWWMKRGLKSRWNPVDTLANVTDLYGTYATGALKHSFNVGLELSTEESKNASYTVTTISGTTCPAPLTGFDCTLVYDPNPNDPWTGSIVRGAVSENTTDTVAVYAQDSISIGERWVLNLGVRYDDYSVESPTSTPQEASWDFVNYQAGLVYKPTANTSVYASYSTSSTPPNTSGGDQNGAPSNGSGNLSGDVLDPEETESFEVGAKANLFGERLALSGAVFQMTRKNAQILVDTGVYEQAGETEVKGVELGISGNITPAWTVFGGYTYMDSELVKGAVTSTGTPPVVTPNAFEGLPLANTPEHSVSLFTTYRVLPKLTLGGGVYYTSKAYGGNQGGAGGGGNRIYAPEHTRIDLFGSYELTDRASLQLNVQNVADEEYISRTNGVHHADVAPGRQAILKLNVSF